MRGKGIRIKGDWVGVKVRVETELPFDLQRVLQRVVGTPHVLTFGFLRRAIVRGSRVGPTVRCLRVYSPTHDTYDLAGIGLKQRCEELR